MTSRIWFVALLSLLPLAPAGCGGSGPTLYPVRGTVTLDSQPLAQGLVTFKTVETGVVETFDVKDGAYQGKAQAGERRVEIYSFRTKTQDISGMKTEVKENLVPPRYNLESKLTADVTPGGPNNFPFDLKSN